MYSPEEFQGATLAKPFSFTKHIPLLKLPDRNYIGGNIPKTEKGRDEALSRVLPHQAWPDRIKTVLYDLEQDPHENRPIEDAEITARLRLKMTEKMLENDAPPEQYERMGLQEEYRRLTRG